MQCNVVYKCSRKCNAESKSKNFVWCITSSRARTHTVYVAFKSEDLRRVCKFVFKTGRTILCINFNFVVIMNA